MLADRNARVKGAGDARRHTLYQRRPNLISESGNIVRERGCWGASGALGQATDATTDTGTDPALGAGDAANTGTDMGAAEADGALAGGSMMEAYDADGSGSISEEEFGAGLASQGTFQGLDTDGDGMISQEEFEAGMPGQAAMWQDLDAGGAGTLSEEEFGRSLFGQYDADGSGELDETEFGEFETATSGGAQMDGMGAGATDLETDAGVMTTEDPSMETEVETEMETDATDG